MAIDIVAQVRHNQPIGVPTQAQLLEAREAFLELALLANSQWSLARLWLSVSVTDQGYVLDLMADTSSSRDLAKLKDARKKSGIGPVSGAGALVGIGKLWAVSRLAQMPPEYGLWLGINRVEVEAYALEYLEMMLSAEFRANGGVITMRDYLELRARTQKQWPGLYRWPA